MIKYYMATQNNLSNLVPQTEIGSYIPENIIATSSPEKWNTIQIDVHDYPDMLEDGPIPPPSCHLLGHA